MKTNKILLLSVISILSLGALSGCAKADVTIIDNDDYIYIDDQNVVTTGYEDVRVDRDKTYFQGVHNFKYTKSGKAFIRNGATTYKLVIPDEASSYISLAREEFTHFFKIATDIDIECITDRDLEFNKTDTYISLGRTNLLKTSGLKIDYTALTNDGCRIITKNNTIFIVGGTDIGTLNSVYDFLHIYFRYEQYSPDVYEIDRNVKNIVLYNFDVTDIPDVPHRAQNYGFLIPGGGNYDQSNYGYRLRMTKSRGECFMPVFQVIGDYSSKSVKSTNTNTYVPFETYSADHPDWFSDLSTAKDPQLCYTAHGNAEEYESLVQLVVDKIKNSMVYFTPDRYPDLNVMTFTMEDNFNICNFSTTKCWC